MFVPFLAPIAGGALIGLGAALLLFTTGKCAGISGMLEGLLQSDAPAWRWMFVVGLLAGGVGARILAPGLVPGLTAAPGTLALAGLVVGFGARVGGGCTSGHGVIGNSRLSPRSIVATVTFMAAGFATVAIGRLLHG